MTVTNVKAHTRGKEDPLKPVMEARKARFCRKWGIQPANTDDARLAHPVAAPARGGPSLASIIGDIRNLVKVWKRIGE
jgi:hypothetical protein